MGTYRLTISIDQASLLQEAFRQTFGSDGSAWTNEAIGKLSEGSFLGLVLDVLNGHANIVLGDQDPLIRVINRGCQFEYPSWVRDIKHIDKGPTEYDISDVEQWFHPQQQRSNRVIGWEIYEYLEKEDMINDCLSLADLLAIKIKGFDFFEKYFSEKEVFAWKSIVRDKNKSDCVPYLTKQYSRDLVILWSYTTEMLDFNDPALRFKKV